MVFFLILLGSYLGTIGIRYIRLKVAFRNMSKALVKWAKENNFTSE